MVARGVVERNLMKIVVPFCLVLTLSSCDRAEVKHEEAVKTEEIDDG